MIFDVTLGRYYRTQSPLHSLDVRSKMAFTVLYIVSVFLANSITTCLLTFLVLCILIRASRVPLSYMLRGLKAIFVIIVVTDLINILSYPQGWIRALINTLRMIEIVLASNLLTLTSKPKDISDGLEKALSPLSYIGLPVHDLATMISIAIRFLPILTDEARKVMDAQRSRGADFESGNLIQRAKALMPVLIPLFNSAFKRADQLSEAMDSRLYGYTKATRLHPLRYSRRDACFYLMTLCYLAVFLTVRFLCL